ncbi:hypothetical protein IJ118_01675 [Candidatus Saccharibacteria bacterium]|nr:hypothetical protein [Candidatus Saccharibacteria bacterium]
MNNTQIYKKTIKFSLWRLLWDFLAIVAFVGFSAAGFVVANQSSGNGLIGLAIGAVLGGISAYLILHFLAYTYTAGQIAMMTEGVTTGKLPDNPVAAGRKIVKERFATVAAYYAVTGIIKGIFSQIGQGITAVGKAVGGDTGGAVGGTISSAIQTVVAYLCDCCLGWVFYRKDEKATRATLEGAVIFFKHGKTLAKNLGRVFGMGALSLLIIGGIFAGITYLILQAMPDVMGSLSAEVAEAIARNGNSVPELVSNPTTFTVICSLISGVIIWSTIHSTFVRPFILVGVLRNFMKSGIENIPKESEFAELDKKSAKFKKLHSEVAAE